jgi:peptide/nickel transport system ATP-binding protein
MVMQGGELIEEGETERLFRAPQSPYTQALIEASGIA